MGNAVQVRMLRDTDYTPRPEDSPRCFGQLRPRPSLRQVEVVAADGSTSIRKEVGPMVLYFRAGTMPELPENVAAEFVASGAAEPYDGPEVEFVTTREILDGIPVQ